MYCYACNKRIHTEIGYHNLFIKEKTMICKSCYEKEPLKYKYQKMEYHGTVFHWFSLFEEEPIYPFYCYFYEYSKFVKKILDTFHPQFIYTRVSLYQSLEWLDELVKIGVNTIFIITEY